MSKLVIRILLILIVSSSVAFATEPDPMRFQNQIKQEVNNWATNLEGPITTLFWLLVTLDFAWTAIQLALKAGGLEDFASTIIKKLFFYGFGVLLLTNGTDYARAIIESFIQLAGITAGSPGGNPLADIWDYAFDAVTDLYNNMEKYNWLQQAGLILLNGFIIIAMVALCSFISIVLILAYCEAYIVISLSAVLLALNGANYTSEYGKKFLHYSLLAGLKLFATIILAYLGILILREWAWTFRSSSVRNIGAGTACFVIYAVLVQKIPGLFVNAVSGGGLGNSGEAIGAQAVKMAGSAVVTAATGGAAALGAAKSLASEQVKAAGDGSVAAATAKNLGKAFSEDMKGSFSAINRATQNRPGLDGAGMGQRMAANLDSQTNDLKRNKEGTESEGNSISAGDGNSPSTGTVTSSSGGDSGSGEGETLSSDSNPENGSPSDPRAAALMADTASAGGAFSRSTPESPGSLQSGSSAPGAPVVQNSGSGGGSEISNDFAPPGGSTVKADSSSSIATTAFDPTGDNMGTSQGDSAGQISNASGSAAPTAPQIKNSGAGTGAPSAPASTFSPPVGTSVVANSANNIGGNMQNSDRMEKIRKEMENFRPKPF